MQRTAMMTVYRDHKKDDGRIIEQPVRVQISGECHYVQPVRVQISGECHYVQPSITGLQNYCENVHALISEKSVPSYQEIDLTPDEIERAEEILLRL